MGMLSLKMIFEVKFKSPMVYHIQPLQNTLRPMQSHSFEDGWTIAQINIRHFNCRLIELTMNNKSAEEY